LINKVVVLITFFATSISTHGQDNNYTKFYNSLSKIPIDSSLKLVDKKILDLTLKKTNKSTIINYLELKLNLADSSHNNLQKHYSYEALLNYPNLITQKKYHDYLYGEAKYQNKIGEKGIAIDYFLKALEVSETIKDDTLSAKVNKRMGIIYVKTHDYNLALKYLNKSLNLNHKISDSAGIVGDYMTLGNVYKNQGIFDTAMTYYTKSLNLSKTINYERGLAGNYNNIGNILRNQKKYDEALKYYLLALEINISSKNRLWESYNYNNIGLVYKKKVT